MIEPQSPLPLPLRFARWAGLALCGFIYLVMISWGSMEFNALATFAVLIGLINPLWGIGGIALFGPMFLTPTSHHGLMPLVDALALGIAAGTLRGAGRRVAGDDPPVATFGVWPIVALGLMIGALAAAWPAFVLLWFEEDNIGPYKWIRYASHLVLEGGETNVGWGLRSLVHWGLGIGIAVAAARYARRRDAVLLLKIGAIGVVLACLAGMLDEVSRRFFPWFFSLDAIRSINTDPQQFGRFQGTAGHAGWLSEWMLLWAGGLLLILRDGGKKTRAAVIAAMLLVLMCLVLTAARASWFAALAGGALLAALAMAKHRPSAKTVSAIAIAVVVIAAVGALIGGDAVTSRFDRLLRFSDRINYFSSGSIMLREFPFGIGIGLHHVQYAAWFTDRFHYQQFDYVTSHNQYLHLFIEQGPFMVVAFILGGIALIAAGLIAWRKSEDPLPVAILVSVILAMMIDGLAQYFFYIRVIEYSFWIIAGLLVGWIARTHSAGRIAQWGRYPLLALFGIAALLVLKAHSHREIIPERPRPWVYSCSEEGCFWTKWTPRRERFPIEPTANGLTFSLFRLHTPANVSLVWPDGHREQFRIEPGEFRRFFRNFEHTVTINENQDPIYFEPRRWMEIEVDNVYVPAQWPDQPLDPRGLGVFINHVWQFYYWEPRPEGWELTPD